jgi:thioesterase domain-containing protein
VVLDVRTMAASYIELVREQQPKGPYLLGGVSFGGILAYEMAQQLRDAGESVALLALFDAILPRAIRPPSAAERARLHLRRLTEDPRGFAEHISERIKVHMTRWSRAPSVATEDATAEGLNMVRDELFRRAAVDYDAKVQPYPGPVVMFRAKHGLGHDAEKVEYDRGWSGLLDPRTLVHEVDGTHLGILGEPGVFEIARALRRHLREVDERPPMPRTRRASSSSGHIVRSSSRP